METARKPSRDGMQSLVAGPSRLGREMVWFEDAELTEDDMIAISIFRYKFLL